MASARPLLLSLVAVSALGTAPAAADPIALTGGGVSIGFRGRPHIWTNIVVGDSLFSVTRDLRDGELINPRCPCPVGSTIDVSNLLTGAFVGAAIYMDGRPSLYPVEYEGFVRLTAAPAVVREPIGPGFLTSGPFEMFATLSAFHNGRALFLDRSFVGSGTFGLMLESDASFLHLGYDLPEVPEPSTLSLLGTGLAAVLARLRRTRRTRARVSL